MKRSLFLSLILSTLLTPLSGHAAFKCWTNKEGVRECGNAIPPEYSQQESQTIDKRGITVKTHERAMTKEEVEQQEQQEAKEKEREAKEEEIRKKQEAYDRVLLSTFLSEQEIINARDRKFAVIDANIEITQISINKLKDDLQQKRKKAANYERKGQQVPERTLEDIATLEKQIATKQEFIKTKEAEKVAITEKYAKDQERFRQLKEQGKRLP